jgi:hypothetical protein
MDTPATPEIKMPKVKQGIPTIYGLIVLLVVLIGVGAMLAFLWSDQDLSPSPLVEVRRTSSLNQNQTCVAGGTCKGPSVTAQDPEDDQLTYKFYDKATGELVREIKANSGETVTPEFQFASPGEKQLYMVVEDGSGHTSQDYPIIIPVK